MARVSRKQLEGKAETANRMLEQAGSSARIVVEARYDYHALDMTTTYDLARYPGSVTKTLRIGSTGELWTWLDAFCEGIYLTSEPYAAGAR